MHYCCDEGMIVEKEGIQHCGRLPQVYVVVMIEDHQRQVKKTTKKMKMMKKWKRKRKECLLFLHEGRMISNLNVKGAGAQVTMVAAAIDAAAHFSPHLLHHWWVVSIFVDIPVDTDVDAWESAHHTLEIWKFSLI